MLGRLQPHVNRRHRNTGMVICQMLLVLAVLALSRQTAAGLDRGCCQTQIGCFLVDTTSDFNKCLGLQFGGPTQFDSGDICVAGPTSGFGQCAPPGSAFIEVRNLVVPHADANETECLIGQPVVTMAPGSAATICTELCNKTGSVISSVEIQTSSNVAASSDETIPDLGQLPLLCLLLKKQSYTIRQNSEFVVLITPHIINPDKPAASAPDGEVLSGSATAFIEVAPPAPAPALGREGLAALALALVASGVYLATRKRAR